MTEKTFKWVGVGDLQIPYHDKRAVELFFKASKYIRPDAVDVTGDCSDQLEYSSFSDGTTDEFFNQLKKEKQLQGESDEDFKNRVSPVPKVIEGEKPVSEFFKQLRKQHRNADIHFSGGNHESRVWKYMDKKAPDYLDEITPQTLWGLENLGITHRHYSEKPLERFAGIHVHHGVTTSSTGLAVKQDIDNYNISLMRGHDHRGGVVYKTFPMADRTLVGIGTGHLCDVEAYGLKYTINPSWEMGFAFIQIFDGAVFPQFIPIQRNESGYFCVVNSRVITN